MHSPSRLFVIDTHSLSLSLGRAVAASHAAVCQTSVFRVFLAVSTDVRFRGLPTQGGRLGPLHPPISRPWRKNAKTTNKMVVGIIQSLVPSH